MGRRIWIAACCASVAVIAAELIWVGVKRDLGPSDWAAWVQAFGSIGAILASGMIANWQYKRNAADQDAQRRRSELVPMLAILTLLRELQFNVFIALKTLDIAAETDQLLVELEPETLLESIEASLRGIPLHQLPSPEAVRDMAGVLNFIPYARREIASATHKFGTREWEALEVRMMIATVRESVQYQVSGWEGHVRNLGGDPNTGTHFGR